MYIHTYEELTGSGWTVAAFESHRSIDAMTEMKAWCYAVYGEPMTRWKDSIEYGEVRFEDQKDLTLFLLRWS